jgi:hypothetical protein
MPSGKKRFTIWFWGNTLGLVGGGYHEILCGRKTYENNVSIKIKIVMGNTVSQMSCPDKYPPAKVLVLRLLVEPFELGRQQISSATLTCDIFQYRLPGVNHDR